MADRPLWTCPKCGAQLVGRNMWHACGPYTVETFLAGKGPRARALFEAFVRLLERCGPVIPAPAKTRVAFMVRVRFAGVSALSERGMTVAFALRRRLDPRQHPRVRKVETYNPRWHGHFIRIADVSELDDELLAWLKEAYAVGEQRG